ncbi:tol-pal system protein YbgF [Thermosulfurimonas marina]|uniref:Tol-pal system protein YbgF n=1 Tax=Thermosulfurimonas marina TaxID=2047767 RepID=A0A6H1WS63_9BACT|nr:tol-pal system protein YbgF [Thermosulfurimonas marina]QJA06022.1 tol-pal system protein YbgF [Thermosulfurimonas marina]
MRRGIFLLLALLLVGCVSDQQFQGLALRVSALEVQQTSLEKARREEAVRLAALEKRLASLEKQVSVLSEKRAELLSEIEALRAEIARLNGLYEELSYQQKQDREAFSEFQAEVLKRLSQGEKPPAPAKAPSGPKTPSEKELYDQALAALKKKDYEGARKLLQRYLEVYPQGKYAANAHYWIAETYYAQRRYEEAILEYQKVVDGFPQSYKVPAALLKQGLAFLRIGDTEAARILFKKILSRYPQSEQAPLARKYLKRLSR